MFKLRQQHLDAFAAAYRESFQDHMIAHLREKFPDQCEELGEQKLRERIADGIERANRYDIRAQKDVARFIRFMFGIGPNFDTARKTAWVQPILKDKDVPASERLERIREEARQRRREERQKQYGIAP
jgi:hypothetical protein